MKPVYDESYAFSSLSFLLFIIPLAILFLNLLVERTAICGNGLYQNGILLSWSNFIAYSWTHDGDYDDLSMKPFWDKNTLVELIIKPRKLLFARQIRLVVPYDIKQDIESILSKNVQSEKGNQ